MFRPANLPNLLLVSDDGGLSFKAGAKFSQEQHEVARALTQVDMMCRCKDCKQQPAAAVAAPYQVYDTAWPEYLAGDKVGVMIGGSQQDKLAEHVLLRHPGCKRSMLRLTAEVEVRSEDANGCMRGTISSSSIVRQQPQEEVQQKEETRQEEEQMEEEQGSSMSEAGKMAGPAGGAACSLMLLCCMVVMMDAIYVSSCHFTLHLHSCMTRRPCVRTSQGHKCACPVGPGCSIVNQLHPVRCLRLDAALC